MKQYLALVILVVIVVFTLYATIIKPMTEVIEQRIMTVDKILQESK